MTITLREEIECKHVRFVFTVKLNQMCSPVLIVLKIGRIQRNLLIFNGEKTNMESLHEYGWQCSNCNNFDFSLLFLSHEDVCPACDVKYHWDYMSTLTQYKIGLD